jgi:exodeoxyribonuclease V alpha subunit
MTDISRSLTGRCEDTAEATVLVEATVVHTIYSNQENGWSVVRCKDESDIRFTAVGPLLGVRDGDRLRLSGRWIQHQKFGEQLETSSYVQIHPSTIEGIRSFLASGRVRGIGPRTAERLVESFGVETLDVIEHQPEKLRSVRGIGRKTAAKISESWGQYRGIQQLMLFLTGHGINPSIAIKVFKRFEHQALDVVRSNPYRLAEEVYGVGFPTADQIAQSLGMPEDAPQRLGAGLVHVLQQASLDGHLFLPRGDLLSAAAQLLGCRQELLAEALESLILARKTSVRTGRSGAGIYLPRLERAEANVALGLSELLMDADSRPGFNVEKAMSWYQGRSGIDLAPQQQAALAKALSEPVVVITGGPGTGKTTLIQGVCRILAKQGRQVLLAAPTGRAAKRLGEATRQEAKTLHRMLEFNPVKGEFACNRKNPLDADLVVVDEVSMLDIELAAHLLAAIPLDCRLVLVGDSDQLPSVGPGNVLADIIASRRVPVVRLDEIFRQARESLIVTNAHRINRGEMPQLESGDALTDFYMIAREDPVAAANTAVEVVCERIPRRFGLDPIRDIQVLAPMHRGELGVVNLNQRLQSELTPQGEELKVGNRSFRVGDKVMQIRNNYGLEVFNGDLGRVISIDHEERELLVSFDNQTVAIADEDLQDVVPAYACTIHKSQGSEYPAVVVMLHHQHHLMLQRNLLYTAITRGKQLVVIIGSRRALQRAVTNATIRQRNTMLAERVQKAVDRV